MKKIYSLALVLALLLSLSTPALATLITDPQESASIEVKGSYQSGTSSDIVYNVDIAWSNMHFSYNGGDKVWNPETHDYTATNGEGSWLDSGAKITVTNNSNAFLTLECTYTPNQEYSNTALLFSYPLCAPQTELGLVYSAEVGTEQIAEIVVTPDPSTTLPDTIPANTTIGNITVEIGKWTPLSIGDVGDFLVESDGYLQSIEDDVFETNDTAENARAEIQDLRDAIEAENNTNTGKTYAQMIVAYFDAYTAMESLRALNLGD